MPKPKTDLNSDIQESRVDLTPKETATLKTANEQLKYTNFPITIQLPQFKMKDLTLSWRRPISYRNQSIDLLQHA